MSVVGDKDFHFPSRKKWDYDRTYLWFANPKKISQIAKDVREGKKQSVINSDTKKNNKMNNNTSEWSAIRVDPSPKHKEMPKPVSFSDPFVTIESQKHEWPTSEHKPSSQKDHQNHVRAESFPRSDHNTRPENIRSEHVKQDRSVHFQQDHGVRQEQRHRPEQHFRQDQNGRQDQPTRQDKQQRPQHGSELTKMSPSEFRTRGLFATFEPERPTPQNQQLPHNSQKMQNSGGQKRPEMRPSGPRYTNGRRELSADDQMILRQAKRDRAKGLDVPEYDGTNFEEVYAAVQMVRTDNYMFLFVEEKKNKIKAKVGTAVAIASAFNAPVEGVLEDTQSVLASHEQVFENQFYLAGMPQPSSSDVELWKSIATASLIRVLDNVAERHKKNQSGAGGYESSYRPPETNGKGAIGKLLNVAQTFFGGGQPQPKTENVSYSSNNNNQSNNSKSPVVTTTTTVPGTSGTSGNNDTKGSVPSKKMDSSWLNEFDIPWAKKHQSTPAVTVSVGTPIVVGASEPTKPVPSTNNTNTNTPPPSAPITNTPVAPITGTSSIPPSVPASVPKPAPVASTPVTNDLDFIMPPPSPEEQRKMASKDDDTKSTSSRL
jgi:hypothetical protein